MKTLELFPTLVDIDVLDNIPDDYIKQCKDTILNQKSYVKFDTSPNDYVTSDQYILDKFPPLKDIIIKYINQYVAKFPYPSPNYKISSSWGYISKFNNLKNNWHSHTNSNISGVFYLTKGASIAFNQTFLTKQYPFAIGGDQNHIELEIQEKQLVIFPSYLDHCILENKDNSNRISIAFNSIPTGEFGEITSKLNIQ